MDVPADTTLQEVVSAGAGQGDAACVAAVALMLRAWAAECRHVALKYRTVPCIHFSWLAAVFTPFRRDTRFLPFGGLFLAGGLANKLLPHIRGVRLLLVWGWTQLCARDPVGPQVVPAAFIDDPVMGELLQVA